MTEVKAAALGAALTKAGVGFDVLEHERTDTAVAEAGRSGSGRARSRRRSSSARRTSTCAP